MNIKKQLFEQFALIAHSLGSPQRIEMLDYLAQAERSVDELSQLSDLTVANTSRHLQILKQNGLVRMRKQGKSRLYQLAGDDVVNLIQSLRQTASHHLATVDQLKTQLSDSAAQQKTMTAKQLVERLKQDDLLILDVRPQKEFSQGHIQGAVNVPPDEIEQQIFRFNEQSNNQQTIVTYCRGPFCSYSYQMIESLSKEGIDAFRLEQGFPEWKAAGLPFETN